MIENDSTPISSAKDVNVNLSANYRISKTSIAADGNRFAGAERDSSLMTSFKENAFSFHVTLLLEIVDFVGNYS